jgi:D-glucuronyl C5-epimerase C-terminus
MIPRRLALAFPIDWTHRRPYSLASIERPGEGAYFISWDPGNGIYGEDWTTSAFDAQDVLIEASGAYHPIRIAQYALHLHAQWLQTNDAAYRDRFLKQADWLRVHQERTRVPGTYRFAFPWRRYGVEAGWSSAMAQGEAISVLLRAEKAAPHQGYGDAAWEAATPFTRDIPNGGVVWENRREIFFEEVATADAAHILNGCIYALWGLWELWQCSPEGWTGVAVERCAVTLRRWLPHFDTGWWTRYSLMRTSHGLSHLATLKYHAFHIAQMRVLAAMFSEPAFGHAAERWESYVRSPRNRLRVLAGTAALIPARL